jgi:hypothetical protein
MESECSACWLFFWCPSQSHGSGAVGSPFVKCLLYTFLTASGNGPGFEVDSSKDILDLRLKSLNDQI